MKLKVILEVFSTITTQNKFVSKFFTVIDISVSISDPLRRYRQRYRLMSKTVFDDVTLLSQAFLHFRLSRNFFDN